MPGPVSSPAEPLCGARCLLHRLGKAAAALSERGNLLASMHWSLPRPTSKAEQQMSRHLEVRRQELAWCSVQQGLRSSLASGMPVLQCAGRTAVSKV